LKYDLVNGLNTCVEVGTELYEAEFVRQIIAETVNQANSELADFEQIKKFKIPHRKFMQKYDELTPTSKVKQRIIMANFNHDIESLYQ
jgi:long-chain acyl-CoA synthetase